MEYADKIWKLNQVVDDENSVNINNDFSEHLVRNTKLNLPSKCADNIEKQISESICKEKVLSGLGTGKKLRKDVLTKVKKVIKEPEKRLPADMMFDDKRTQGRIKKQFDKQNVSYK